MKATSEIREEIAWLGRLIQVVDIENLQIVSFFKKDFETKKITENIQYTIYIDGKKINELFPDLITVLAFSASALSGNANSAFSYGFIKMVSP